MKIADKKTCGRGASRFRRDYFFYCRVPPILPDPE